MNHFTLFVSLFYLTISFSQTGSLSGSIVEFSSGSPLEFSQVALYALPDSNLVDGAISLEDGSFDFDKIPFGNYYLEIKFIGFKSKTINDLIIEKGSNHLEMNSIFLLKGRELAQIDVTSEQKFSEVKIDKKIFNADKSIAINGGTGLDLMREIPSVTVDENDNILLRGNSSVSILIDGRPVAMSASQLLKQLPATAIDRVELITNPSAKYDPEGMSGILNVILKKNKLKGFNGSVRSNGGYGILPKISGGINLSYRNSKLNIYTNYNFSHRETWFGGNMLRDVLLNDSSWNKLRSEDLGARVNTSNYGQLGVDYFINSKNTIYMSASVLNRTNLGTRQIDYWNEGEDEAIVNQSIRNGIMDSPYRNYVLNTGWQKTFSKPDHTLDLDFNYNPGNRFSDEQLNHNYFNQLDEVYLTNFQNTLDENNSRLSLGKLDYYLPITDSLILEAGFHFTRRSTKQSFYSESGLEPNKLVADINLNNRFNYDQNTYASYLTIGKQFKNIGAKFGIRAEQTETLSSLINTSEVFKNNYFKLFPSAHLSYTTKSNSELQLSYSKRINRPSMQQLNPFSNYSDPLTLDRGNPFLQPEIIHVNELSYMKFWKKFNINVTIYNRLITNLMRRSLSYEGTLSIVSNENLGKSTLNGADLNITFTPKKGLRITSNSSLWITSTKAVEFTGGERVNYLGANSSLRVSMQLERDFSAQAWGTYSPKSKVIQGEILANYGGGVSINKKLLKQKGNLGLSIYDILKTRRFTFVSDDLGDYQFTSSRQWESRSIYLSFTYNFGTLKRGPQKRRSKTIGSGDDRNVPEM